MSSKAFLLHHFGAHSTGILFYCKVNEARGVKNQFGGLNKSLVAPEDCSLRNSPFFMASRRYGFLFQTYLSS
jgi:hypothetical protein